MEDDSGIAQDDGNEINQKFEVGETSGRDADKLEEESDTRSSESDISSSELEIKKYDSFLQVLFNDPRYREAEVYDETCEKVQMIRVNLLRLAHRLGHTPNNIVGKLLHRLWLVEEHHLTRQGRITSFSCAHLARKIAEKFEASGEPLDYLCTIMVLGKSGVGKSATINSIFDGNIFRTDAFQLGTKKVHDVLGTVQGIRVRAIDTPGLLLSWSDQRQNKKILHSVKKFIKKTPPDVVLYFDRLDIRSRDSGGMPLLRSITEIFGPSIWKKTCVVLTHASSVASEGPNGITEYDEFVIQRSIIVLEEIRQAARDMSLRTPFSVVENHPACRRNTAGQRLLPNGEVWKPNLLLLSFASKVIAEMKTLLKLEDTPQKSSPSKVTKAWLEKLIRPLREISFDELEYRKEIFMTKQMKAETERRKMMKKMQETAKYLPPADYSNEKVEEETNAAASGPAMLELTLPASFDSNNLTHQYRNLDSSNLWLVRAVLRPNGWDHWQGDLAIGCNLQTQIPVGRETIGGFNINIRGSGQVSVLLKSSEQLQIILIGLIPLVKKVLGYSQTNANG